MFATVFSWVWMFVGLTVILASLRKLPHGIAQFLLVAGGVLHAAAGLSNGLVMALNGARMPVEEVKDRSNAPRILMDRGDADSWVCRAIALTEPDNVPGVGLQDTHWNVPTVSKPPTASESRSPEPAPSPPQVRLAFLDDRHAMAMCESYSTYSKGDIMFALGAVLWAAGIPLMILGVIWRRIRRRPHP